MNTPQKHISKQGFTLVEFAISVTVIGLLIGGILRGQEMISSSRILASTSLLSSIETAVGTFYDRYNQIPGDMPQAHILLPGCNNNIKCRPIDNIPTNSLTGDRIIGDPNWGANGWKGQIHPTGQGGEVNLAPLHLHAASLLPNLTDAELEPDNMPKAGKTQPKFPINGSLIFGFGDGSPLPGFPKKSKSPSGMILAVVPDLAQEGTSALISQEKPAPLTAHQAEQIDRKLDDGFPDTGEVVTYGDQDICFGIDTQKTYQTLQAGRHCGLIFKIRQY